MKCHRNGRSTLVLVAVVATTVGGASAQTSSGLHVTANGSPGAVLPAAQACLQLTPASWDFGEVWFGEPVSKGDITITNVGAGTLEITRVQSSCGCTGVTVGKRSLGPGESTFLRVGYDTTQGAEQVKQTVTLHTNDPEQPAVRFELRGRCRPLFDMQLGERRVTTPTLQFGQLSRTEPATAVLRLRNRYDRPVYLSLPKGELRHYGVELREIEPGQEYELTATTMPPLPSGSVTQFVMLATDLDFLQELRVRVTGRVPANVRAAPAILTLPPTTNGPVTRDVRIIYPGNQPVSLLRIEADDPRVRWEIDKPASVAPGASAFHLIKVTLPPAEEIPAKGFKLTITTDSLDSHHLIDGLRYMETIHYNPVKHGYMRCQHAWEPAA